MKKLFFVCFILILVSPLLLSYEYIMNNNIPYGTAAVNTKIAALTGGDWDDGYYDLVLPSTHQFYFYGKKVTHIRIWTNGYVTFGFGSAPTDYSDYSNDPIPNVDNPDSYAAPWWDDWDLTANGEIWYILGSSAPNYWVAIEWRNVPHNNDSTASYDFQFFVTANMEWVGDDLTNRANTIMFNYMDTDSGTGVYDYGVSGTVGIEHYTGSQCEKYSYNESSLNNSLAILFTPFVPIYDTTDDNANGVPDLYVWRPSDGINYKRFDNGTTGSFRWGTRGDVFVPGDYDGDGDSDTCVFRPSNSVWYSSDPSFGTPWGTAGDIPVPSDYDNDGATDIAVFRPSDGRWYIKYWAGGSANIWWGTQGDIPVPADYDNDGQADCAVYRPSENRWYIRKSSNPASDWNIWWGTDGDVPFPANRQHGSAYSTLCVYRPSTGTWYHKCQVGLESISIRWGAEYDQPVPNDVNGNGYTDEVVFRPSDGMWYQYGLSVIPWGTLEDKPRCRRNRSIVAPNYSVDDERNP
jgi:hypothetical protein